MSFCWFCHAVAKICWNTPNQNFEKEADAFGIPKILKKISFEKNARTGHFPLKERIGP